MQLTSCAVVKIWLAEAKAISRTILVDISLHGVGRVGAQEIESAALEVSPAVRKGGLHKLHAHPDTSGDSPAKIGVHADPGTI